MKVRLSTTVDEDLLRAARNLDPEGTDASMAERALRALLAAEREAEIDRGYDAYVDQPPDTPDDWGNLAEFSEAAARAVAQSK